MCPKFSDGTATLQKSRIVHNLDFVFFPLSIPVATPYHSMLRLIFWPTEAIHHPVLSPYSRHSFRKGKISKGIAANSKCAYDFRTESKFPGIWSSTSFICPSEISYSIPFTIFHFFAPFKRLDWISPCCLCIWSFSSAIRIITASPLLT